MVKNKYLKLLVKMSTPRCLLGGRVARRSTSFAWCWAVVANAEDGGITMQNANKIFDFGLVSVLAELTGTILAGFFNCLD